MNTLTLKQILTGNMSYDNGWAILARQDEQGNFSLDSEAKFHSAQFDYPSGWEVVSHNADYMDAFTKHTDLHFHVDEAQQWKEEFAVKFLEDRTERQQELTEIYG
jgi:hypothetical protein